MAKKKTARRSGKRELIKPKGDARYVRRSTKGTFTESDDVGRSQAADWRKAAKKTVKSGYGDPGDRPKRKAAKKSTKKQTLHREPPSLEATSFGPINNSSSSSRSSLVCARPFNSTTFQRESAYSSLTNGASWKRTAMRVALNPSSFFTSCLCGR